MRFKGVIPQGRYSIVASKIIRARETTRFASYLARPINTASGTVKPASASIEVSHFIFATDPLHRIQIKILRYDRALTNTIPNHLPFHTPRSMSSPGINATASAFSLAVVPLENIVLGGSSPSVPNPIVSYAALCNCRVSSTSHCSFLYFTLRLLIHPTSVSIDVPTTIISPPMARMMIRPRMEKLTCPPVLRTNWVRHCCCDSLVRKGRVSTGPLEASTFFGAVAHSTAHACSLAREVENQSETSFCHW